MSELCSNLSNTIELIIKLVLLKNSKYRVWMTTISSYKYCLRNFQSTVFGVISRNMKKMGKMYCERPKWREYAYRHSLCFTEDALNVTRATLNKMTVVIEFAADQPEVDDMIPGLCCGFQSFLTELENDVRFCDKITKRKTAKFFRKLIQLNVANTFDSMCVRYSSIRLCHKNVPDIMAEVKVKIQENYPMYNHTAFVSLLRFIERLESEEAVTTTTQSPDDY